MIKLSPQYLAGFFDGEGCISLSHRRNNKTHRVSTLCVYLTQKTLEPLDQVKEQYGGTIYMKSDNVWRWEAYNNMAKKFLQDIYPYLVVKSDEAYLGLLSQETKKYNPRNYGVDEDMVEFRGFLKQRLHEVKKLKKLYNTVRWNR